MSQTVIVWDKEGNAHKMSPANARDMIRNVGWTQYPPIVAAAQKAAVEAQEAAEAAAAREAEAAKAEAVKAAAAAEAEKAAAAAEAAAEAALKASEEAKVKAEESVDAANPEKMSVDELKQLAINLGIKIDDRWGKTRLLKEIHEVKAD